MTNRGNSSAGIGDPYFYEWTVGQKKILEMLNPDSNIRSVILQKDGYVGIDDVVVNYLDGSTECIQVKHTRVDDSLTFNDLVYAEEGAPLLKQLADAWKEAELKNPNTRVILASNRKLGVREATKKDRTKLPSLEEFWASLKEQIGTTSSLNALSFDEKYREAFEAFKLCLSNLSEDKQVKFLRCFELNCNALDLTNLEQELASTISSTFGVPPQGATRIFQMLDHGLREWATSRRNSEDITPEMVLSVLSKDSNNNIGDHEIPPPAPFFPSRMEFLKSFEKLLFETKNPVVFLCGVPGSGKTSLVSFLANNVDPAVQIRFHAFKPIAPEGKIVSADTSVVCTSKALWSDLLNQVRKLLRGRLAKYRVPVINDFLTTDELRDHFLRLAVAYSKEIGKRLVIGIDGIDHAARAGVDGKNLLNSLISPERVPAELLILIAGQPPESYPEYPIWLKTVHSKVQRVDVPLLDVADIALLCRGTGVSIDGTSIDSVAKVIFQKSQGNTLPSVFAAYEAKNCASFAELENRLDSSQLSGELGAYYDNIWHKLVASLGEQSKTKQVRIAAALCLLTQKLTSEQLEAAYSDFGIRAAHWKEYLVTLYPLIVRDSEGFRVLHNDVRIYLNSILSANKDLFSDAAKRLLQFVKHNSDFALSRHADLGNLLKAAGPGETIIDIAEHGYVTEGWALGRPHGETAGYLQLALDQAVDANDWTSIHKIVLALTTLRQLVRVTQHSDFKSYRFEHLADGSSGFLVLGVEKYVLNPKDWSLDLLQEVLSSIEQLWEQKLVPRARALFIRWFNGFEINSLITLLSEEELYEHNDSLSNRFRDVLVDVGYWSSLLRTKCFLIREPTDEDKDSQWVYAAILSGRTKGAALQSKYRWARQLRRVRSWFPDVFEEILDDLFERRQWPHIRLFSRCFPIGSLSKRIQIKITAYLILAGETDTADLYSNLIQNWEILVKDESGRIDTHNYYFWVAFCKGYIEHTRPVLAIAEEIQTAYFSGYRDDRTRPPFARVVFGAAVVGQALRVVRSAGDLTGYESDLTSSLRAVAGIHELRNSFFLHNVNVAVTQLLFGFSYLRAKVSPKFEANFKSVMLEMAKQFPADGRLEPLWAYLVEEGQTSLLEKYYDHFFSKGGVTWAQDVYERLSLVEKFKPLVRPLGWDGKIRETDDRLAKKTIGFDSHKDYVLATPLQWYRDLNRSSGAVSDSITIGLLAANQIAEDLGDNRMSFDVETEVIYQAARLGPTRLWQVLSIVSEKSKKRWFKLDYVAFYHALIRMMKDGTYSQKDLLAFWVMCIGGLSWTTDDDQRTIEDLKNAILASGKRLGCGQDLIVAMQSLGKTEFELIAKDYGRRTWWFNDKDNSDVEEILKTTEGLEIEKRIKGTLEQLNSDRSSNYYRALAALFVTARTNGVRVAPALLRDVFSKCLKQSYGYSWHSDSLDTLISAMSSHVDGDGMFQDFLRETVKNTTDKAGDDIHLWVDAVSYNLDQLCRYRAQSGDVDELESGLNRWIQLLVEWALSDERDELDKPAFDDQMPYRPQSWGEFVALYLTLLTSSTMTEQIFAALRGLWAAAKTDPASLEVLPSLYDKLRPDVKMRLLGLCERIYAQLPEAATFVAPVVSLASQSDLLGESIQAWVAECALARAQGRPEPVWSYSRKAKKFDDLQVLPVIVTDGEMFGSRRLSSEFSAVEVLLRQLGEFVELNIDETAAIAFSINTSERNGILIPFGFDVSRLDRGMRATPDSGITGLYEALGDLVVEMGTSNEGAEMLANSILKSDDPFLILESPQIFPVGEGDWPASDSLQKLLDSNGGEVLVEQALNNLLNSQLEPGFEILAGYISSYSSKMDIELFTTYGPRADLSKFKPQRIPYSFNGRLCSLVFQSFKHPIRNSKTSWVAWRCGGLSEYSSIQLAPASSVMRELELSQSKTDPLVWLNKDGKVILRHQEFSGPVRSEVMEPHFRQPKIQRWMIESSALKTLLSTRSNLERKTWLEKHDYERPR